MPIFAALFGSFFSALGLFLAKIFAVKLSIRVVAVASLVALSNGLVTLFNSLVSPLIAQAFSTQYGQFIGLAFPPVSGTILTGYMTAILAISTYRLQARAISVTAGI